MFLGSAKVGTLEQDDHTVHAKFAAKARKERKESGFMESFLPGDGQLAPRLRAIQQIHVDEVLVGDACLT